MKFHDENNFLFTSKVRKNVVNKTLSTFWCAMNQNNFHLICVTKFMFQKLFYYFIVASLLSFIFFASCRKDKFLVGTANLKFSTDTLTFDTVFTTIGSTTQYFKIYNPYSKKVRINRIHLQNGSASLFRLNVDGKAGNDQSNIDIEPKDSIYVFVAVTVDPNNKTNPIVIYDKVVVETTGSTDGVTLQAWGQDVYINKNHGYFKDRVDSIYFDAYATSVVGGITNGVWKNDKPHLVFGIGVVYGGKTMTVQQGSRIYMHSGAYFFVFGAMNATGTKQDSIVFQGDRLEHDYDNIPGQWGSLQFLRGSQTSTFTHVTIKNASDGLVLGSDTSGSPSAFNITNKPHLVLNKCTIKNCDESCIFSFLSDVDATNCLFYNTNQQTVQLLFGGNSNFKQCTIADYNTTFITHNNEALRISNWAGFGAVTQYYIAPVNAKFSNCIVFGSLQTNKEINIDQDHGADTTFKYTFDHCLIRTDLSIANTHFLNCFNGIDNDYYPVFNSISSNDYSLGASSPAINAGSTTLGVMDDINDKLRDASPDIGCYEK